MPSAPIVRIVATSRAGFMLTVPLRELSMRWSLITECWPVWSQEQALRLFRALCWKVCRGITSWSVAVSWAMALVNNFGWSGVVVRKHVRSRHLFNCWMCLTRQDRDINELFLIVLAVNMLYIVMFRWLMTIWGKYGYASKHQQLHISSWWFSRT